MNLQHFQGFSEILTLKNCVDKDGKNLSYADLSIIKDGSIIIDDNNILWVGKSSDVPSQYLSQINKTYDCKGKIATPALVDSHTHLLFQGNRSHEYFMRLSGASYEEIAKSGGGITYTSSETNNATEAELYLLGLKRLEDFYKLGVIAVEIKSGYCLTLEGELRMMRVIDKLAKTNPFKIFIHRTLMSAHAVPQSITKEEYIQSVVIPSINQCAQEGLVDSVDIFHEVNYFSEDDVRKIFTSAKKFNLNLKIHADELNNNHGAKLAATLGAISADHLLETDHEGAKSLANNNVIATVLPGTALFLGKKIPNAKMLTGAGCALAIASDFNPGSCHHNDVFSIARTCAPSLKINPAEFWCAITYNASKAIGIGKIGALIPGYINRFLIWDEFSSENLLYNWSTRQKCNFSF